MLQTTTDKDEHTVPRLPALIWPPGYTARAGQPAALEWSEVVRRCAHPLTLESKADAPGWSFTRSIDNRRTKAAVEALSAVVLDVDGAEPGTLDGVAAVLESAGLRAAIHSTHSHRPELERFRVIVPLSRLVTPAEFATTAKHVANLLPCDPDAGSFDVAHTWRQPSRAPGAIYRWKAVEGEPVDVDALLAAQPAAASFAGSTMVSAEGPARRIDHILAGLSPRLRGMIERGPTIGDGLVRRDEASGAAVADRSRFDFALIVGLVDAGCSDDEVRAIFEAFPEGCGQRCAKIGSRAPAYLAQSVARARAAMAQRTRAVVKVDRLFVSYDDAGGVASLRLGLEPCAPVKRGPHILPAYLTLRADCPERWDAAFAAFDLATPDPRDAPDTESQARWMVGGTAVIEVDEFGLRRILPHAGVAA